MRGNNLLKVIDKIAGILLIYVLSLLRRKRDHIPENVRNVLVVKLSAIGDTILLMPSLRSLRARFPDAKIVALGTAINKDVFGACPYVDEVLLFSVKRFLCNPIPFIRRVRSHRFDIAIDFDQWVRITPLLCRLSGARYLIGFRTSGQGRHYLFDKAVEHRRDLHEIECFLSVVAALGGSAADTSLEYPVTPEALRKAGMALGEKRDRRIVLFHPSTPRHGAQRQWPAERYVELGRLLTQGGLCDIVITGTASEQPANREIARGIGSPVCVLPAMSIDELAAMFSMVDAIVCGNTGVMHLACAVDAPVAALHGPTDPRKWGPRSTVNRVVSAGLPCSPCLYLGFEYGCRKNTCIESIPVRDVYAALTGILAIASNN